MKNLQPFINFDTLRVWCPGHFHGTITHLAIVVFMDVSNALKGEPIKGPKGIWVLQNFTCDN